MTADSANVLDSSIEENAVQLKVSIAVAVSRRRKFVLGELRNISSVPPDNLSNAVAESHRCKFNPEGMRGVCRVAPEMQDVHQFVTKLAQSCDQLAYILKYRSKCPPDRTI